MLKRTLGKVFIDWSRGHWARRSKIIDVTGNGCGTKPLFCGFGSPQGYTFHGLRIITFRIRGPLISAPLEGAPSLSKIGKTPLVKFLSMRALSSWISLSSIMKDSLSQLSTSSTEMDLESSRSCSQGSPPSVRKYFQDPKLDLHLTKSPASQSRLGFFHKVTVTEGIRWKGHYTFHRDLIIRLNLVVIIVYGY